MNKLSLYFLSGLFSVTFIVLTGWIASYSSISILHDLCFYFHLIPFGIGFLGGSTSSIVLYYFILWIGLTLIMIPIIQIYDSARNKRIILISTVTICTLGFLSVVWVDHSIKKEREDIILENENEDKKNFNYLKTGDIIFQTLNDPNNISVQEDSDSMDNKIAIINVDITGYTVLEISDLDLVQHASLRSWIKKNGNYTVKRLINADSILTEGSIEKLREERQKYVFKSYDYSHCWSGDKIYGSELIWKTYKRALNIELGTLEVSKNSNENKPEQEKCNDDYTISPMIIFNSDKLITITKK